MEKDKWLELSQRGRLSPFPNYLSMESITKEMKRVVGCGYKKALFILKGNNCWFYLLEDDYRRVGEEIFKKVKKSPRLFSFLASRQKQFAPTFLKNIKADAGSNLTKASDKKLAGFHRRYENEYKRIYAHYFPILAVERVLMRYLSDYLLKIYKDDKVSRDYLNKLTTEPEAMVNQREHIAALKLAVKVYKNKEWLKYFRSAEKINLIKKDTSLRRLIKSHEQKWFWLTRDYEDDILTFADFVERIGILLKSDPVSELNKVKRKLTNLKLEVKKIEKNIDEDVRPFFQSMRDGLHLKELRKSIVSQSLYYYDPIMREIARRGGLSLRQARFLKTGEVYEMLVSKNDFSAALNERLKLSLYESAAGSTKIITGRLAEMIFNKLNEIPKDIREIKGSSASGGRAFGPVKIVKNPNECSKVKRGDVIVTGQAVPSFSSAISVAAALVADGGTGITSHSATLAREAGIPCVTGAKIATQVLKDGDMVEVDANKGIVRKLY